MNSDPAVRMFMMLNTLGMAIITEAMIDVRTMVRESITSSAGVAQCSASLAFLIGTGLEMIIEQYQIGYDPDMLRKNFFTMLDRRCWIESEH